MSDLRRFVIEEGDWEIDLPSNGGYEILGNDGLQKHGTHDQSTHNPHKSSRAYDPMGGYKAGNWTKVTDPVEAERLYIAQSEYAYQQRTGKKLEGYDRKLMEDQLSNPNVVAIRRKELEGAEVWQNGSTLLIAKRNDGNNLTDPRGIATDVEIRGLLAETDRMQRDYPIAGLRVHIDNVAFEGRDKGVAMFAYRGGASSKAEPHIFIKTSSMRSVDLNRYDRSTYFAPRDESINIRRVSLTHEWGHLLDTKGDVPYELKDRQIASIVARVGGIQYQSVYGSSHPAEQYAEAFASFVVHKQKGWKMTNPLTIAMAEEFKW